jgi:hypothetical protein
MEKLLENIRIAMETATFNLRLGQALFNSLPMWAGNVVAGTPWDPFHKDLTRFQMINWINDHLIFLDGEISAVFSGEDILAERP